MAKAGTGRSAAATKTRHMKSGAHETVTRSVTGQFVTVREGSSKPVRIKVKAASPLHAGHSYVLLADPAPDATSAARAFEPGPWARAILRGKRMHLADLEASGGAYDLEQVQIVLGNISRSQVADYVKAGKLLAVPGPSNRRRYPVVQFDKRGTLISGLDKVQEALDDSPWVVLNFLIRPDARLKGQRPIDVLEQGQTDAVVAAARRFGESGA